MDDLKYVYDKQKEITFISGTIALLVWDKNVMMPSKGINDRAEQLAMLNKQAHEIYISPKLYTSLNKLRKQELKGKDKHVVERFYKDVVKARKIPSDFVEELSRVTAKATHAWQQAKTDDNFKLFEPHLKKIIELKKKEAKYINLKGHPYNSLLDQYEEGMTVEKLDPIFESLKEELKEILKHVKKGKAKKRKFDVEGQKKVIDNVLKKMGLPEDESRRDEFMHPFTIPISRNDVRITTKYDSSMFGFFASVHEAGHALYELGQPDKYYNTAVYGVPSLGAHESQSRFWELMVAKSYPFWKYMIKDFKKAFDLKVGLKEFYDEINQVKPSLIRVTADEVTYCLHIILRYELEKELIEGKIKVRDLPKIWNERMKEYLGVVPKTDREGVLQDVHWSQGGVGYFPTYAIGTMYAAKIWNKIGDDYVKDLEKGEYSRILQWLRKNIHSKGRLYTADELFKKACGDGLNSQDLIKYLKEKYVN